DWLQAVAHFNPLTYEVDALRALMLKGGESAYGLATDAGIMAAVAFVLVLIPARLYPGMGASTGATKWAVVPPQPRPRGGHPPRSIPASPASPGPRPRRSWRRSSPPGSRPDPDTASPS